MRIENSMRLRTTFLVSFLLAGLLPLVILGGVSYSPSNGWGSLLDHAFSENLPISLAVILIGLVMAISLMVMLLNRAVRPIETAVVELRKNAESQQMSTIDVLKGKGAIREFQDLQDNYNFMVRRMAKSSDQLKRLAYVDSVTDLPNREKFQDTLHRVLANEKMLAKGGSVIFFEVIHINEDY